ncbi:TPA: hypothetical protein O5T86_001283 [Staphylococcus aureus]|nr:hypothetical protein [Staphylococcus aureus]HDA7217738.1 hypothetical protein [Staphylococcus aureus]HDA7235030.1 hypothetical protein [Staphylococcus aureus]HDA7236820.1 hypothetical protein [Staphylococcus aureus]HDA7239246.1 hypothetical protein [Staphylococcus aureus]
MASYLGTITTYLLGMMAMWNFMRTAYAYPDISRWFYAWDAALALAFLLLAFIATKVVQP